MPSMKTAQLWDGVHQFVVCHQVYLSADAQAYLGNRG